MAGFANVGELADAEMQGQSTFFTWRKSPTQATAQGIWFDLSMSPGNPVPQYYAASPLVATPMAWSTDNGIRHGGSVSPKTKHLKELTALTTTATALPMQMRLLDYLLYYPFVDESVTDAQEMDNTLPLPRYTDGVGVQMMAVEVAAHAGTPTFFVTYTNSAGVGGRVTPTVTCNAQILNGTILTSAQATAGTAGPFIPLQAGDSGIRSIDSVTMVGTDVGLFSLVLVKPIAQMMIRYNEAPVEKVFLLNHAQLPVIKDDAYLNFICCPVGSLAATAIHGDITTVWN